VSIRTLLLLLVLAVWLPAVAGFALLARSTYLREASDARQDIERFAQSLNSLVERELDKRVVTATTLSASQNLLHNRLGLFHEEATAATRDAGSWVVVVDAARQYVNTLAPFDEGRPLARVAGAPFVVGEPRVFFAERGLVTLKPVLVAYAPGRTGDARRYNVGVSFAPSVVQALIGKDTPFGSLVAVIDRENTVIARSRDPEKWVGEKAGVDIQRRTRSRESSYGNTVTLDGVPSLTYVSEANRYGWRVVLALPQASLTEPARRLTAQTLAAAGSLLLIGLGIAAFVARRVSEPILALRDAAALLGQDQVPPALATRVSELDDVSRALAAAGRRSQEATRTLQQEVAQAVNQAREAQAALLEGQKHEAIGRLTGGLAHDFNNLLQTISTGLHIVDRRTPNDVPHRRFLEAAMRATGKAADLVRQMMTFGRAQPLKPRPVRLLDFVLQTQELTRKAVGERIRLAAEIEPALPAVLVDPAQLELALLNLVFNARDAMPESGGAIRITARQATPAEVAPLQGKACVWLEVSDDGLGMSAETRERAFDPYFTTKPVGAGTGLGLAQVLAFARQSGGDARLESAPGAGTRVSLLLPATDEADLGSTALKAAERPPQRHLRILMIEDDALVSSVVVPALRDEGHEVTHCDSADQGLALLQTRSDFDVLFTDVVMPGQLSGLELVDWCRTHQPTIAAVVATGYNTQQARAGVQELRKPYGLDDLLDALQRAVHHDTRSA
jgi:signal transduction histidine kinase/ActR/RegA family two-component response regulator